MSVFAKPLSKDEVRAKNAIAAALSIVPGLGHIYKGHLAAGLIWLFFGMPFAIWIGILLGLATGGLGLLFPILCWGALAYDAYYEKDLRGHHWLPPLLPPWTDDENVED
jgi:TM2 domain-containing membrane protein YozV